MITDLILLLFLLALIGGILLLVSSSASAASTTSTFANKNNGREKGNVTKLNEGTSIDWSSGEVKLRTNHRPVTQQEILENAERKGQDGGKFVTQHAESFRFGNKDGSS